MAPSEFSAISDVKGSGFISDHKIISCVVDFPSLDTPIQKVVTFCQYHKLNIDKFRSDLLAIPFVSSPSDDIDLLHEQYMSGLSGLYFFSFENTFIYPFFTNIFREHNKMEHYR